MMAVFVRFGPSLRHHYMRHYGFQERYGIMDASRQPSHSTIPPPTAFERQTDTPGLPAAVAQVAKGSPVG
jgi:hypothetical protein